ncbi:hypothetical protein [Streptomyces sp. NRRL S-350]|uniref:hypothetical protein n=1 Tax=Streptomyces sp. NRRL S-350 TaxID=1463902 RepID=UPI00131DD0A6|nr:hypothetical protein [Streptomyces sp. NRRL S-350]
MDGGSLPGTGTAAALRTAGRGALRFLLTAIAGVGTAVVVAGLALWKLLSWTGPDPTDTVGFGRYLLVAALWAVGMGLTGLFGAQLRRSRGTGSGLAWLAWCDLGLVLAFLWPLQVLAVAGLCAVRAGGRGQARAKAGAGAGARWLGGCAALAGVCLSAAGSAWGVTGYEAEQPWTAADPAGRAVTGTWTGPGGETLTLQADGRFRATVPTAAGKHPPEHWYGGEGRWRLTDTVDLGRTLTLAFASGGEDDLVVYGALSPSTICRPVAEEWCQTALHR